MRELRNNPHIYEINLMAWLYELSEREGKSIAISTIPNREWEILRSMGMDAVWLMGIWERSSYSKGQARKTKALVDECRKILPEFELEDLGGSPYAIKSYRPDNRFGSLQDVTRLRDNLAKHGLALILDFVPNHTACDHRWVPEHPEYYINVAPEFSDKCPEGFFMIGTSKGAICLAHGKDPYFPPWTDTAQLNHMNPDTHRAMSRVLQKIATVCDGVRCDMAMLILKDVFNKTWAQYLGSEGGVKEFWPVAVNTVREKEESFVFIAEAYWGLGKRLLEAGLDYVYDKDFYDALIKRDIHALKSELSRCIPEQERKLRFVENHDELRAITAFGEERIMATMVIHATVPGAKLWHHGQFEGRKIRVPVQLKRCAKEAANEPLRNFSLLLLREVDQPVFHWGTWQMCAIDGWLDNHSAENIVAWTLQLGEERRLIVVNFCSTASQGRVRFSSNWFSGQGKVLLHDPLKAETYIRKVRDLKKDGLFVSLEAWDFHFFHVH